MTTKYEKLIARLDHKTFFQDVVVTSENENSINGWCPFHETPGQSKSPSFWSNKKNFHWKCHGCGADGDAVAYYMKLRNVDRETAWAELAIAAGITPPRLPGKKPRTKEGEYEYHDRRGVVVLRKVKWRLEDGKKSFTWYNAATGQTGLNGATKTLYRIHRLLALKPDAVVAFAEGEKKADLLAANGFEATCTPDGAGEGKWRHIATEDVREAFGGKHVLVFPDQDPIGLAFGHSSCRAAFPYAASVKLIMLPRRTPMENEDICDWIESGGTWEEVADLVRATEPWKPDPAAPKERDGITDYWSNLEKTVDELEQVILNNWKSIHPPIFVRGRQLVRLTAGGNFSPLKLHNVLEIVSRFATVEREDAKGELHACELRDRVVETWLARADSWRLPRLRAVVRCPFVTLDGTIVAEKGYNAGSEVWIEWEGEPLQIPQHPTRADALAACSPIFELFDEFDWVEESDWSAAFAALLTVVQRPALRDAPMFAITAPTPSSGKSLLANICAIIGTGQTSSVTPYHAKPEEMEKVVMAKLLSDGSPVLLFDNVSRAMDSDILCQLLTEPKLSRRLLGGMEMSEAPTTVTVFATGNNICVAGDLLTRAIFIAIDTKMQNPEERVFKRDAMNFALQHRRDFVRCALTIVRAYQLAGYPGARMDSRFKDWSRMIRSALIWLNMKDPAKRTATAKASNPVFQLLEAWHGRFGVERVTCSRVLEIAEREREGGLAEILAEIGGRAMDARRLSQFLTRHKQRLYGDKMLDYESGRWGVKMARASVNGQAE